jgi:hypothetical protein
MRRLRRNGLGVLLITLLAPAWVQAAATAHGSSNHLRPRVAFDTSTSTTYSGTVTYTRSFNGPNNDCSESINEDWTVSFNHAVLPDVTGDQGPTADGTITGSIHEHVDCPDPNGGPDSILDYDATSPGIIPIALTAFTPGQITIDDEASASQGLGGTYSESGANPTPQTLAPFWGDSGDIGAFTVPAVGGSKSSQTPIPLSQIVNTGTSEDPNETQDGSLTISLTPSGASPPAAAPVARCDAYWARPNTVLVGSAPGVLGNDASNGHGPLKPKVDHISFGVSSHPYSLSASGALQFKATKPGTATITYHDVAADGTASNRTTATIYIAATKPAAVAKCPLGGDGGPKAVPDTFFTAGKRIAGDVLRNDVDPGGGQLTVTSASRPAFGTAACSSHGTCTYVPGKSYDGHDSFLYTVRDSGGLTATARVLIRTKRAPKAPDPLAKARHKNITHSADCRLQIDRPYQIYKTNDNEVAGVGAKANLTCKHQETIEWFDSELDLDLHGPDDSANLTNHGTFTAAAGRTYYQTVTFGCPLQGKKYYGAADAKIKGGDDLYAESPDLGPLWCPIITPPPGEGPPFEQ